MSALLQKVDDIISSLNNKSKSEFDLDSMKKIINEKEKYFRENDFLWNSDLMFRVWRISFLNLMKQDGFTKQVSDYNQFIRNTNKHKIRKRRIKKYGNDVGSSLDDLDNKLNDLYQQIESINGKKVTKTTDTFKKQLLYEKDKTINGHVRNIISNHLNKNKPTVNDYRTAVQAIEVCLRGRRIDNLPMMKDLINMIKSTFGVFVSYNDYNDYNDSVTYSRFSAQRNAYLEIMQILSIINNTGKHLDEISKSDIGFITLNESDRYNSSYYNYSGIDGYLDRILTIKGTKTSGKDNFAYKCNLYDFLSLLSEVDDDEFYSNQIHYEFGRRALQNHRLLHILGIYGEYKNRIEKKNKFNKRERNKLVEEYK